jgi:hypothetical protein
MATKVYETKAFSLVDGVTVMAGPLKIKYLREFLEIFDTIKKAKNDDESVDVLSRHKDYRRP